MFHITRISELEFEGKSTTEIIKETEFSYKTVKKNLYKEDFSEEIPKSNAKNQNQNHIRKKCIRQLKNTPKI
ncbi:MAG: hypothetical protein PHR10_08660 [Sphaerochaetaceae bacterium]|nr:hypothetical protein [Sphaerochaetaceae bacterium]